MDDGVSEEAHKSTVTKVSKVAEVSATIALNEAVTTRSVKNFSSMYDRIQAEFQQKLVEAYSKMRITYMEDFQENFNQNSSRRDDKISEMMQSISHQENCIRDLEREKNAQKSCLHKFYAQTRAHFVYRQTLRAWKAMAKRNRNCKRIENYAKNKLHRKRMRLMFCAIRQSSHLNFKAKWDVMRAEKKRELEITHLDKWKNKVDALMLYMAQLEDKIKLEQDARQKLAEAYDRSLSNGFKTLSHETQMLQVNPLIGEVVIKHYDQM